MPYFSSGPSLIYATGFVPLSTPEQDLYLHPFTTPRGDLFSLRNTSDLSEPD